MSQLTESITTIFVAIIGVAILAVIVSKNAQTSQVLQSIGQLFATSVGAATAPVTGASVGTGMSGLGAYGSNFAMPALNTPWGF